MSSISNKTQYYIGRICSLWKRLFVCHFMATNLYVARCFIRSIFLFFCGNFVWALFQSSKLRTSYIYKLSAWLRQESVLSIALVRACVHDSPTLYTSTSYSIIIIVALRAVFTHCVDVDSIRSRHRWNDYVLERISCYTSGRQ